ncbi:MAG: restriction endonuclease subunit S [Gemmiger sp.]|uniref:restriction endonuclease subunit S n=1 Tax=Gemmiger sp. TaxID=2049027 RepID=UPI002A915125|nr:restriction endonuclease subunit S [Gemmiger sp.]MDY5203669.1 restriction endonuclease subunit S [Gemmiger sp.]
MMKLEDCATIIAGQSPKSEYYNTDGNGLPFFQGKADFGELYPQIRVYCSEPIRIAEKDDILLSVRAPVGPTNLAPTKVCIGRGLSAIRPNKEIERKYLLLYFRYFEAQLSSKGTGTTFKAITQRTIRNLEIPVLPLEKQQRIVSRIEDLFSELDKGVETLQTIKEQLAVYRQAVLKEALNGIKGQPYTVKDVCKEIKVGIVIKPSQYYTDEQVGIKAFRSANVREFHVEDKNWAYLSIAGHQANARSIVHTGDILIVRSGYPGTACVVPEQFNGCNAIDILIAVPNRDLVLPEFLCAYTNSPLGKKFVNEKKRGVGQKHFNVSGYSKMLISVPSLDKQEEIVKKIASRLSVCDSIEQTVDTALAQAEAMRQSILKKAFEGELCK